VNTNEMKTIRTVPLFFLFFLSGANGLVYEIVFRRQFLLSLGVTHYSVGTILTVYMTGLGAGSLIFGRAADRTKSPLLLFGILEAGTGLLGLSLLALFPALDGIYTGFLGMIGRTGAPSTPLKAAIAGAFLIPPTILMGGTLPLIGKALAERQAPSARAPGSSGPIGLLYGVNTLGGVAGSIGVTFWLLGALGARRTLLLISSAGIFIGMAAALLSRSRRGPRTTGPASSETRTNEKQTPRAEQTLALIAIFASGFCGLSLEVYWTRVLAYIIGSHGYAFGVTLAAFLAGIALGSLVVSRAAHRISNHLRSLGALLLAIGASLFGVSAALYRLRGLVEHLGAAAAGRWARFISMEMGAVFCIFLIPTFLLGAVFPVVIAAVTKSADRRGGRPAGAAQNRLGTLVGRAYSLNTLGSILGAFASSFVLIPLVGIAGGIRVLVVLTAGFGLALLVLSRGGSIYGTVRVRAFWAGAAGAAALAAALFIPLGGALQALGRDERLIFYKESSSATVSVREDGSGDRMLSVNGLDEVPVDVSSLLTFRLLGHLPLLLHPDPRTVMVLSLGGAVTTGSVAAHDVGRIDAVELCPPVLEAASFFEKWNHGVLRDPRLRVVIQDGRNHLLTAETRYDVITADATHPWSADSWILYTREFYELVKKRLAEGGLFCQWVPLHSLSPDDYRCILRTIHGVFPRASLWYTGSYTVVLAGKDPAGFDPGSATRDRAARDRIAKKMERPSVRSDLASVGIDSPESLLGLFLLSGRGIERYAGDGALNTDDAPYLEHAASRCYARETTLENLTALVSAVVRYGESPMAGVDVFSKAREKLMLGRIAAYEGNFERAVRFYEYALTIAPGDGVSALFLEDARKTLAAFRSPGGDTQPEPGQEP
jgi:spermidine synthase